MNNNMSATTNTDKINTMAKLLIHLDIIRPDGDDALNDPNIAHELMQIGSRRVALLKTIDKFDVTTQQKIGERYKELAEEHNNSLLNISILYVSGEEFFNTQISPVATIGDLLSHIFKKKHKLYTQYTLLFNHKELDVINHKETLTHYGIKNGSCLNIIIHDERNTEYVTTIDENGGVRSHLNVIDSDTDLFTLRSQMMTRKQNSNGFFD